MTKFFIYFGADDVSGLDTSEGKLARADRVYYDTPEECRKAIRALAPKQQRRARVEESVECERQPVPHDDY